MDHRRKISVIGLGYVGLPVAVAFGTKGVPVVAFDIDQRRIDELRAGHDSTQEVTGTELAAANLTFTAQAADLAQANFHIVTVPTPITDSKRPELNVLVAACKSIGAALKLGDIVVFESTVYPGATEETCVPVLEEVSGLTFGTDFTVGYSPERINPGDKERRFETIQKVVSGSDAPTLKIITDVYGSVVKAGLHLAPTIQVAEAAKVIENTQRDVNIALMNELSVIFNLLGIDTNDVLEAAGTKWNFLPFTPGLVGGHCIGVDPYYLTHRAEQVGFHPEVILSGRRINDFMGEFVAKHVVRAMMHEGVAKPKVTVLGMTFKENVPDFRNTRVVDIIEDMQDFGIEVSVHDPLADPERVKAEYGLTLMTMENLPPANAVVIATGHQVYRDGGWDLVKGCLLDGKGFVADVRSILDRDATPNGVTLWRL